MSDDTVRVTYPELAKARGVTVASAKRIALRHRWPKQIGNDGRTRVIVPMSALPASIAPSIDPTVPPIVDPIDGPIVLPAVGPTSDLPPVKSALAPSDSVAPAVDPTVGLTAAFATTAHAVASLEAAVAALRDQLATSNTRTDQAEKRVQELQAMLDAEITEHRRVVAALIEKLPAPVAPRRVWWPWGRR